ncbi:MAG: hypothetical protein Q3980_13080 [Turicibacter sp.]|nr:hypothetical protein [Turicibacter sp.]
MITVREVGETLGLTYDHIRKRKDLGVTKIGTKLMITEEGFKILQEEVAFKSASIPSTETQKLSGLKTPKLCKCLKQVEEWRIIGGVTYFKKEALEQLLKEREPFKDFLENSITLSQAQKLSGIHKQTIRKYLKEGQEWKEFDGGCYVDKTALERLMKERGISLTTQVETEMDKVPDGYTHVKQVCNTHNLDYHVIRDKVRRGLKEHTIKVNNRVYLKDDIIPNLVDEYQFIRNSYRRKDLEELLNISTCLLETVIEIIKKDVEWKKFGITEYFDKAMIDQKIDEFGEGYQYYEDCRVRVVKTLSTKRKPSKLRRIEASPDTLEVDNDTFIKVESIQNFYNLTANGTTLSSRMLKHAIKRGSVINTYENELGTLYVSKKELESIKHILDNSIAMSELGKELLKVNTAKTQSNASVRAYCSDDVEVFSFTIFGNAHNRIRTQNPKQFKSDFVKRIKAEFEFRNTKKPHDRYELLEEQFTKEHKEQFSFAIKTYKEFAFTKINNSNSNALLDMTHELFNALSRFINVSPNDIHLLSDDEILQILSSEELTATDRGHFSVYLNYLRQKYSDKCQFKNHYNRYKEARMRAVDDIYTLEEWTFYSNFLTDINQHIEKAFERYSYAKRWLYAILHFSVAWRSSDFLETPGLDFLDNSGNTGFDDLDIDKYSLDWFKNNDFKLSDGQIIINSVKKFVEDRETRKTGARKHFIVPIHYVIPVSIAFIITEQHRRASNSSTLFSIEKIELKSLKEYLGEEMAGFSSRKANRSLISYLFNEANESENYSSIAYSMGSYLRSHKPNMYQKAETTSQYIYALSKDGDINTISSQLFRRGVFGWLYKVMIDLAYSEEYETLTEMTTAIETLQKDLSASGIENISRFLTYELDSRRSVLNELVTAPKDKLKELIHQLILGNLSSKERNIYCIKPEKCPFTTQNSCKGCRYSIPTNYSLLAISDELFVLFDKLSLVEDDDNVNRRKYTFQITRLMMVLREAKTEFDQIDPNYFKTFVPLRKLSDRMTETKPKLLSL